MIWNNLYYMNNKKMKNIVTIILEYLKNLKRQSQRKDISKKKLIKYQNQNKRLKFMILKFKNVFKC